MSAGMSELYSDVVSLIDNAVEARVQEKISQFAKNLAERYRMNIHDILACSPAPAQAAASSTQQRPAGVQRCRGICGKGKNQRQCSKNAKATEFYCGTHAWQGEQRERQAPVVISHEHNHPASILFKKGCPICENKRASRQDIAGLIDLGSLTM